jgi:TRAP-type C4-dicarboxylate transport system substrate-binding protein
MSKRIFPIIIAKTLLIILIAGYVAPAVAAPAKPIELSLNLFIPQRHTRWGTMLDPWLKEIEKRTNNQVKITPYFAEALSKMAQNYDSVVSSVADMGESGLQPGKFPITEQMSNWSSASKLTRNPSSILWKLYKEFPEIQKEFKDTKILFLHASLPVRIGTKKQLNSLQEAKGLKMGIFGIGLQAKKLASLGLSVETVQAADAYMAMDRGVVDSFVADYTLLVARKYGEILKFVTNINVSSAFFYLAMNQKKYDSLPADVRKVFDEMSGDYAVEIFGKGWWDGEMANKKVYESDMKGKTTSFSQADYAAADAAFKAEVEKSIADLESKGLPAKKIYQRYLELEKQQTIDWP